MDQPRQPPRDTPPDPDGVRVHGRRSGVRRVAAVLALVLVVGAGAYLLQQIPASTRGAATSASPAQARSAGHALVPPMPAPAAVSRVQATARRQVDANDLASYVPPGTPAPSMGEVIERLHAAGIRTGIGAFNPPGTSPPLSGLAVAEDFPLPPGYVRHYQATDEGQRIEPILMFSPDFEFLDAAGNPVPLPANRVVPPHLSPPGLPLRTVRIPPPQGGRS